MRVAVQRFARRWWEGDLGWAGEALAAVSLPLSWVWSALGAATHGLRASERVSGLTVISVGNLAVGGTGKTPLASWIAARLHASGTAACVLIGGHASDEAELHRRWRADVPVLAGRDRVANARKARRDGARIVVLDDGFQHRRLARDVDVVLLAAEDTFPGRILPRGPYREAAAALARADAVVVTRRVASAERARAVDDLVGRYAPHAVRAVVHIDACRWRQLSGEPGRPPDGDVLAVCAVGRPRSFRATVARVLRGEVELLEFVDHHRYDGADVARIRARAGARPVAVTEKDAIKLGAFADELRQCYVLCDELRWERGEEAVTKLLEGLVAEAVGR